jgi:hypothetical protein
MSEPKRVRPEIVAHCERCEGRWLVPGDRNPDTLEGVCGECQPDSDVERPLTFSRELLSPVFVAGMTELPNDWLVPGSVAPSDKHKDEEPHTKETIAAYMERWFLQRYENPVESCPHDDGEFVYIWGGPYDAREELDAAFGHLFAEDLIEEVATRLEDEHEVYDWSGVPVEERDDEPAELTDEEADAIEELEDPRGHYEK